MTCRSFAPSPTRSGRPDTAQTVPIEAGDDTARDALQRWSLA